MSDGARLENRKELNAAFSFAKFLLMNEHLPRPAPSAAATLDIDSLRAFLAIVDRGGVTAAAERVARTPAAVSMQLKKLEETLGRTLFERSSKGMSLTADGETLLGYARRMLGLHGEALAAFRAPTLSGEVRIGLIDDFGPMQLSEALVGFSETHPDVTVSVAMGATEMLIAKLEAEDLDFSLLTPGCATPWRDTDILARDEPLVWAGRVGGCAHERDPLPVALANHGCAWRKAAIESLNQLGRTYRIAYATELYLAQKAAVNADLAIAPLPLSIARDGLAVLGAEHGFDEVGRSRIALRWSGAARSPAAEALCDRVLEALAVNPPAAKGSRESRRSRPG